MMLSQISFHWDIEGRSFWNILVLEKKQKTKIWKLVTVFYIFTLEILKLIFSILIIHLHSK